MNIAIITISLISIAVAYTLLSVFIQRKLVNPRRMAEIQIIMKEHSKKLSEMIKQGASKEDIIAKQREIMPLMSESVKAQFKPIFIIIPLFFVLYYLLIPQVSMMLGVKSSIQIFSFNLTSQEVFFIGAFFFGIIISIAMMIHDRKMKKDIKAERLNKLQGV
ncbi:MAG: EMC3/TMCO1 family protein [Candidatus Micrarchaeaceae archaeon]